MFSIEQLSTSTTTWLIEWIRIVWRLKESSASTFIIESLELKGHSRETFEDEEVFLLALTSPDEKKYY